jgi:ATP-dependent Lon protease
MDTRRAPVETELVDDDGSGDDQPRTLVVASKHLPDHIPLLPTSGKPVFPGVLVPMLLPMASTEAQIIGAATAEDGGHVVGLVVPRDVEQGEDGRVVRRTLYRVGTAGRILRAEEDEGTMQVLILGRRRFQVLKLYENDGRISADVAYFEDVVDPEDDETRALALSVMGRLRDLIKVNPLFSDEIKVFLQRTDMKNLSMLADFAVSATSADPLECTDVKQRLSKALFLLRKEIEINELKERISNQIEERISRQQREFFLREQLRAIKEELGLEKDEKAEEIGRYEQRLAELALPAEARERVEDEIGKLRVLSPQSPEFAVSRNYLDWLTSLPWGEYSTDQLDLKRARRILDRDHHGLEDVKNRIVEFMGVAKLRGTVEGAILCLVGPPGVGKTSLGKAVAEALGREFYRFSLGGMRDEAEIKGHRRTYIGALPGKVMQAVRTCAKANPVIMLDEIDKVGASFQGDPASALLEVLDPEQNSSFRDHYLDVPFDLSRVLFIATANVPDTIPGPLLDRMELIRLSGYIQQEKLAIARRHLVPRLIPRNGLEAGSVVFPAKTLRLLISGYAREAGVRALEKAIGTCLRKVATRTAEGDLTEFPYTVTPEVLEEYLGRPRFRDDPLMKRGRPGVVMGLAWTSLGGAVLYVEAIPMAAGKEMRLTGQLGSVMSESSHIALSMVSANAGAFGIAPEYFRENAIHIHVPAGATPKDGPSAGITIASALVSLALKRRPPAHLAMTGELTLTGRVLPVGGIREKVIAAKRSKVTHVILPADNEKDFLEIPERVRKGIEARFVEDYRQVFDLVFEGGLRGRG